MKNITEFTKSIGVEFTDIRLLEVAFTHRSYLNEHKGKKAEHNERLEFLGDAVLELVVTEYLYNEYTNPEGELTSWRAALVRGSMLSEVSESLGVGEFLKMSRGEAKDTGKARQYLLANAYEAIVGALYIDQGYDAAKKFIDVTILSRVDEVLEKKLYLDPKSTFQEEAQKFESVTPLYKEEKSWGPDHAKNFIMGVYLHDELVAEGEGNSKQEAQREAAKKALEVKGWGGEV